MRHLFAVVFFVGTWVFTISTEPGEVGYALPAIAALAAGYVSGSFWITIMALSVVGVAAFDDCGPSEGCADFPPEAFALFFYAPLSALLIALGVLTRRIIRRSGTVAQSD